MWPWSPGCLPVMTPVFPFHTIYFGRKSLYTAHSGELCSIAIHSELWRSELLFLGVMCASSAAVYTPVDFLLRWLYIHGWGMPTRRLQFWESVSWGFIWRRPYTTGSSSTLAALYVSSTNSFRNQSCFFFPSEVNSRLPATFHCQAERLGNCPKGRL